MRTHLLAWQLSLIVLTSLGLAAEPLPLKNADFAAWQGTAPQDWTVGIGATSGSQSPSRLAKIAEGGVELAGDATTGQWRILTQPVAIQPGGGLRLTFEAQTKDLKREANQNDNCYVGLNVLDAAGKRAAFVY